MLVEVVEGVDPEGWVVVPVGLKFAVEAVAAVVMSS